MGKKPVAKKPVARKPAAKPAGGHMHDMGGGHMMADEDMPSMMRKNKMPKKGMMKNGNTIY